MPASSRCGWRRGIAALVLTAALGACHEASQPSSTPAAETPMPPLAQARPETLTAHGKTRVDEFYWLRERDNPEVMAYLKAENDYAEAVLAPLKPLRDTLYAEIVGRLSETRETVPVVRHGYAYYTRYGKGHDYPFYLRRRTDDRDAPENIIIDGPEIAKEHTFFAVGGYDVPPTNDVVAYSVDTVGRRIYDIRFRNLMTGDDYGYAIPDTDGHMVWANDGRTLYYIKRNLETLRPYQVYRHRLGTDPATDELMYEEKDEQFLVFLARAKSGKYIFIGSYQTLTTEYRMVRADAADAPVQLVLPRKRDRLYFMDHAGGRFVMRTNDDALNFRVMTAPETEHGIGPWREAVPARDDTLIARCEAFDEYLVLLERADAQVRLRILRWDGTDDHYVYVPEEVYTMQLGGGELANPLSASKVLRFAFTSPRTPLTVYDYDMERRALLERRHDEVRGGFSSTQYATARLHALATDGASVPVSLYWRRDKRKDGPQPLLLKGYGAYGSSSDPGFSTAELSLLDRGVVIGIAHVRGGQEKGRQWYLDGKLLKKKNTFTDFIAVARHLVAEGYTTPDLLFARGGSAGGLLMGAVMNMAPDLFHGIIAHVPFVDVVTTMQDDSIPLTTFEYDEWGNPANTDQYDYMLSYSPYDQVRAQAYPHLLVTTGLHDSQVQYWEPAKWVARLRALKTDSHHLFLVTNMDAGHGGASGRFKQYEETALEWAFLLHLAGLAE